MTADLFLIYYIDFNASISHSRRYTNQEKGEIQIKDLRIGKNASYVYMDIIIAMTVGYLLWILLSRLIPPDLIGLASTVISFSTVFSIIADLGVSRGSTIFLGKNILHGNVEEAKSVVTASMLIVVTGIIAVGLSIFFFRTFIFPDFSSEIILISILIIGFTAIHNLMRSFFIASLRSELLPIITIVNSITKIILTIILVLIGTGAVGVLIGYLMAYASASTLFFFFLRNILKSSYKMSLIDMYGACKKILRASIVSWLPRVLTIMGINLGTVVVFTIEGANQAGFYFIAFSIYYLTLAGADSVFSVLLPILSAMNDRRKRMVSSAMKLILIVTLTVTSAAIAYSNDIMMLFGSGYIEASKALQILLLSVLPYTFSIAIGTMLYAYGNYRQFFILGLSSSVPRIIFYFGLVPIYGNTGAALSFTIGSLVAFAVASVMAKRAGFVIFWKDIGKIFVIPAAISFTTAYFKVGYILGIPIIIIFTVLFLLLLGIISRSDIDRCLSLFPDRIEKSLVNIINKFFQ